MSTTDHYRPATEGETANYLAGARTYPGAVETEHGLALPVQRCRLFIVNGRRVDDYNSLPEAMAAARDYATVWQIRALDSNLAVGRLLADDTRGAAV